MPKRPKNLETVSLALELLNRIPRGRKVSAIELHRQLSEAGFERDLRSIQRQLEMLSERFDIERDDASKPYGYRWKERADALSVPALTQQQSLLLALAELHLSNLLPASILKSMDSIFSQARSNLGPLTGAKREREWLGKVRVVSETQPLLPPKINPGVFEQVSNALFNNNWLFVDYRNASGRTASADVMPLGIAQQGPRLYLVCRFRNFTDDRTLAIHRIIRAKVSTLAFGRPADFNLGRFDDEGQFGFNAGRRIILSFKVEKDAGLHLIESPLSADQSVTETPGHYRIRATVVDTARLDWWLLGFGASISNIRKTPQSAKAK